MPGAITLERILALQAAYIRSIDNNALSRSILIGIPQHDAAFHRSARNIEGVKVAPVAEFNTYDILKQRYLLLTREALTVLRERVKEKPARRPAPAATANATATPAAPES